MSSTLGRGREDGQGVVAVNMDYAMKRKLIEKRRELAQRAR